MTALDIQTGLQTLDVAQSVFSAYCGVPTTRLSQYLNGVKDWNPQDLAASQKALREMLDLAESVKPLPINWSKVGAVRITLEARRIQKTFVVSSSNGYFVSLDKLYRPTFDQVGTALTGEGAHRVCEELRKLNYQSVKATERQLLIGEISQDFFVDWKPKAGV
jgi:hypothetical protein